jgi:hypothetical protein
LVAEAVCPSCCRRRRYYVVVVVVDAVARSLALLLAEALISLLFSLFCFLVLSPVGLQNLFFEKINLLSIAVM